MKISPDFLIMKGHFGMMKFEEREEKIISRFPNLKKNLFKMAFTSSLLLVFQYHLPFSIKNLLGSSPTTYLPLLWIDPIFQVFPQPR